MLYNTIGVILSSSIYMLYLLLLGLNGIDWCYLIPKCSRDWAGLITKGSQT
jgi:hypothetical protein